MSNISLGTHFSDGVRVGPIFNDSTTDINNVNITTDYASYGYGILLSPQNSYDIKPAPASFAAGYTILNNLVATTTNGGAAGNLTLRGDNFSTFVQTGSNGLPLVQFDWPRVVTVTISGADATVGTKVTIFGTDKYNFPMQHTYTVQAQETYPAVVQGAGAVAGTISLPTKAFYTVNRVFISAALPAGCSIALGASDIFGLPFAVYSSAQITQLQWGTQTNAANPNANPIVPVSELTTRVVGEPLTTVGIFVPADKTTPSATSGDVRGLYVVSSPAGAQYNGANPNVPIDWKNLIFTAYTYGSSTVIDQIAEAQEDYAQFSGNRTPLSTNYSATQGVPVARLVQTDLQGRQQFYTGQPS